MTGFVFRCVGVLVVLGACGPSAAEIKQSRNAEYSCEFERVFKTVVDVVKAEQPPLAAATPSNGVVVSEYRWHDKDGKRNKRGTAMVGEGDVQFSVRVGIQQRANGFFIAAAPHIITHTVGSSHVQEIDRNNGAWPPWADGKVDKLMVAIHARLKDCEVKATAPSVQEAPE